MQQLKNKPFWSVGKNLAGEVPAKAFLLLSNVYIARELGATEFGYWSVAVAWFSYFVVICDAGASVVGVSAIARNRSGFAIILNVVERLRLFLAISILLIVLCIHLYVGNTLTNTLLIMSVGLIGYALTRDWVARALGRVEISAIGALVLSITFLAAFLLFGLHTPAELSVARAFSFFIGAIVVWYGLKRYSSKKSEVNFHYSMTEHVKKVLPLLVGLLLAKMYYNSDLIIIEMLIGAKNAGLYAAVGILLTVFMILRGVVATALLPAVVTYSASKTRLMLFVKRCTLLGAFSGFLGAVFMVMFGDILLGYLFGGDFVNPEIIMVIHYFSLAIFVLYAGIAFPLVLHANGMSREYLICTLFAVLINITGNFLFIPEYGITAAAVTTLASEGFAILMTYIFYKRFSSS